MQGIHSKDEGRAISRHGRIFHNQPKFPLCQQQTLSQRQSLIGKFLDKPAQVVPIKDISDDKRAALQNLVKIFSENN